MGFGTWPTWMQIRAQLPCVALSKLLTTLSLNSLICEMGLRIAHNHMFVVWIKWECTWRALQSLTFCKRQHFETKSAITLQSHQPNETKLGTYILVIYSQAHLKRFSFHRRCLIEVLRTMEVASQWPGLWAPNWHPHRAVLLWSTSHTSSCDGFFLFWTLLEKLGNHWFNPTPCFYRWRNWFSHTLSRGLPTPRPRPHPAREGGNWQ